MQFRDPTLESLFTVRETQEGGGLSICGAAAFKINFQFSLIRLVGLLAFTVPHERMYHEVTDAMKTFISASNLLSLTCFQRRGTVVKKYLKVVR